ncbi:MAG: SDR family NAD(P)-dependent oxidoreductase [Alphaproteobacteria bacterium]|jgi:NAD(P)-dependent dehydrogenase (short-subunit alcohol dehydrogenase family)|nr:SDR family NAD(P)-dependent oxidoreductase [Alphaproteobacteria bacterium]
MNEPETCIVAGVGPGLGRALARRFARAGFQVAMLARDGERLARIGDEIAAEGGRARGFPADLTVEADIRAVIGRVRDEMGPPSLLIYNASVWNPTPAMDFPPADFQRDLFLDVTGALVAAQEVVPAMRAAGGGTLLFTGGGLALKPSMGTPVPSLATGKAALRAFVHALAGELAPLGVRVATVTVAGTIAPGTGFDPERIADSFWQVYTAAGDDAPVEVKFMGA